jgi:hypothetical protein
LGIGYYNTLGTLQAAGPTLASFTTSASLLNPQAKIVLPAGFFSYIGQKLLIRAQGQLGSTGTPTFTIAVLFGATTIFTGGAMNVVTGGTTTLPFWLEIDLTCRIVGSSAQLMGQGRITGQSLSLTSVAVSTTTPATLLLPNTAPALGTAFDATTTNAVDLQAACSVSNAANAITLHQYELISPNWGG